MKTKHKPKANHAMTRTRKTNEDFDDFSILYAIPLVGGVGAIAGGGSSTDSDILTSIVVPTTIPVAIIPAAIAAATNVPTSTIAAPAKNNIVLSGAISANQTFSFNLTPGDKNLPDWHQDDVGTDYIIKNIKDTGMNSVVLHFNYCLDPKTDTFFRPTFNSMEMYLNSPDWNTIDLGAQRVVNMGLKPIFYMTVNQLPYSWDSLLALNYVPNNVESFFASYKEQLIKIAELSEKYDSPYLNIGVELGPVVSDPKYLPYWIDIIQTVKSIYDGKLSYSSHVDDRHGYNTELDDLIFTNYIDMLGMNIYPQTLDNGELDGTYEQFYNEWKNVIVPDLQKVIDGLGKPVFFSEFGISRIDGTGSKSFWGADVGMKLDFQEQAELFDAALKAIHEGLDVEGITFWGGFDSTDLVNGSIDIGNSYTTNWIDVPAEDIIAKWMPQFTNSYTFG